jgi:ABC-2 type transport system ATP-binding protein
MPVIKANNVSKMYGDFVAVDNVTFAVKKGEIFGLLGPNGSGKTTILEISVGLKKASAGSVSVLDCNPFWHRKKLASFIGVQLDYTSLPLNIKVEEAVSLFAAFYGAGCVSEKTLQDFGLVKKKHTHYGKLSWGEKQRLGLTLACLHNPSVLFLDEPTSRLDPIGQEEMITYLKRLKNENKTIFINTHNLREAMILCDRVGIIKKGKLNIVDAPLSLIKNLAYKYKITVNEKLDVEFHSETLKIIYTKTGTHIFTNRPEKIIKVLSIRNHKFNIKSVDLADVFLIYAGEEFRE